MTIGYKPVSALVVMAMLTAGCTSASSSNGQRGVHQGVQEGSEFRLAGCYQLPASEEKLVKEVAAANPSVTGNVLWAAMGDRQILLSRESPKIAPAPDCISRAKSQCKALGQAYGDRSRMIATIRDALTDPGAVSVTCTKV